MSLKEIKNKIRAVKKIRQVTKAMEAVSAVKMRKSQAQAFEARPYALHALSILKRLSGSVNIAQHPMEKASSGNKVVIVLVTSDRGLAGALNSNVLRTTYRLMKTQSLKKEDVAFFTIGRKGHEHFQKRGFLIIEHIERWGEGIALGDPENAVATLRRVYESSEYKTIYLIYSNFVSTFTQEAIVRQLLPLSFEALEEIVKGIIPTKGKFSDVKDEKEIAVREYLFEPSPAAVLDVLLPQLVAIELYHAVLESNASEHSARMVAMKSASDRARDVNYELSHEYNKERQSAITAEIGEITSGIEAMR